MQTPQRRHRVASEQRRAFLVLVEHAERTLLGATFALSASLQEEVGIGLVSGAGVDRLAPRGHLDTLNRLQGRPARVFSAAAAVHGLADAVPAG